jgi:hypothetical protein
LGDALIALENMLRRSQQSRGIENELYAQLTEILSVNLNAKREFDSFHHRDVFKWKGRKLHRSPAAVNDCVNEALNRMAAATTASEKAGIACYLAVRLRNTLLHVLENSLDIYADRTKCITMFGCALSFFRIAKHGEDGTFAGL